MNILILGEICIPGGNILYIVCNISYTDVVANLISFNMELKIIVTVIESCSVMMDSQTVLASLVIDHCLHYININGHENEDSSFINRRCKIQH